MIIRKYNNGSKEEYGIVFMIRNEVQKLIIALKYKGFTFEKQTNDYIIGSKDDVKMDIRKNRGEYLVLIKAKTEEKIMSFIKLMEITGSYPLTPEEIDPKRLMDSSDTWIHSDLWGNSMLDMGELIMEILQKCVAKKIKSFWLLRNMDSYDITMDILLNKFKKNENHFYGNIRMLHTLMQTTANNYMITLNKNKEELKTTSINNKVGENNEVADFLMCDKVTENDIIEDVLLERLSSLEKNIIRMLKDGYKIDEICKDLGMDKLTFMSVAEGIRIQ